MDENTKPTPNKKLRHERDRRCWSQQELADLLGTTPLNVGRWERGVTLPGPHFRQKLCEIFEKSSYELGLVSKETDTEQTPGSLSEIPVTSVPSSAQTAPTALWNVPYRRNPFFTGREDILTHLREALTAEGQPISLTQTQAISGLGGIGKTQTALEYAYRYRDSYSAVFWAKADSYDLLVSDYITIAALLHLPERNEQDQGKIVNAVIRWFDSHQHWLLLLDNADNPKVVEEFIPSAGKGHVLLTTRAYSTGTVAQRIELEQMGLDEGSLFLLRRTKKLKVYAQEAPLQGVSIRLREQAQAIVEAVDGLPLALDQAGAYIEETGCSLVDYLKFYKTRRNRLLRTRGRDASGHPEPVAATWSLSFERVEHANPAAAELLRLCAFLHPDIIPEALIAAGAVELGPVLQPVIEDELDLNETIGELRKYSLIKRDPELKLLNIHRLVQAVLKDSMGQERQHTWSERAVRVVGQAFPDPAEFINWSLCQQYLPHVQVCVELIERWNMLFPQAIQLLYRSGHYLRERGQYQAAKLLLQKALAHCQQTLGNDHIETARALNKLGEVWYEQNKLDQAEPLYQEALTIYQNTFGADHADVAWVINNLALLYHTQGKYELAGSFYKQSLEIRQRIFNPDHPHIADSLNNWASLFYDQVQYDQAAQFLERALAIHEQVFGPDHPDVGQELNNLAMVYIKQGKYEQAEPFFLRTLAIWEKVFGPEYHHTGAVLGNLGSLYFVQGRYDEAIALYQRGLEMRRKTLGPEHYEIGRSLCDLAWVHYKQGNYTQAEPLFQEAHTIFVQALGLESPYDAKVLHGLALLYFDQGRYAESEPLFQRALTIREQTIGPEHPDVATTLEDYADLLRKTGREAEAKILEARAQGIRVKHV